MSDLNYPLMRKVLEQIEAHPEQHDQVRWFDVPGKRIVNDGLDRLDVEGREMWQKFRLGEQAMVCGTTACIAGWAFYFGDVKAERWTDIEYVAADLLGLDESEAHALFFTYDNAAAIDKLRAFIATEGDAA